ncbi:MAG: NAD(P)H-hydrate epimerase [Candidatus Omnitrophica bacterium]|nr:NAD(P)H-hydrate epimerase [Candidatus Omnitrophota bacterium]
MMRNFFTARQSRQWDEYVQKVLGIPALLLMENAGRAVAETVINHFSPKCVAVFCGKGNNGADGFVAARHLITAGIKTDVFIAAAKKQILKEAGKNLRILQKITKNIWRINEKNLYNIDSKKYQCIIDGLLGTGLNSAVKGLYAEVIRWINTANKPVVSIDIPSGLDATSGKVWGVCVQADLTVTFVLPKKGMLSKSGKSLCGKIVVADLGVPL